MKCYNKSMNKLLLQFQIYPNAIAAGVEKVYLQINVEKKKDSDYLRFLWFKIYLQVKRPRFASINLPV